MAKDIWDEKPEARDGYSALVDTYEAQAMDAWLEKLRLYVGNLHNDIGDLKETIRNMEAQEKAYMSCIDELKEKAVKYEKYKRLWDITMDANSKHQRKLEAVKEYVEHPFFVFFKEMVKVYNYHFPTKGESWRESSWAYLMDRLTNQLEDMQNDPERENYMANIGNYAAMIRLNEILEADVDG